MPRRSLPGGDALSHGSLEAEDPQPLLEGGLSFLTPLVLTAVSAPRTWSLWQLCLPVGTFSLSLPPCGPSCADSQGQGLSSISQYRHPSLQGSQQHEPHPGQDWDSLQGQDTPTPCPKPAWSLLSLCFNSESRPGIEWALGASDRSLAIEGGACSQMGTS